MDKRPAQTQKLHVVPVKVVNDAFLVVKTRVENQSHFSGICLHQICVFSKYIALALQMWTKIALFFTELFVKVHLPLVGWHPVRKLPTLTIHNLCQSHSQCWRFPLLGLRPLHNRLLRWANWSLAPPIHSTHMQSQQVSLLVWPRVSHRRCSYL